jgi:cyclopropane fatty-acyl-phospholipid synthase-like methyltransferase
VLLASVDDASYDRPFDIVTAFSIFESLTEIQVSAFLSRARAWTKQAIIATIPSYEDKEAVFNQEQDRDLSHITIKSRKWWHEVILKAGWRQDPLHKIVQQMCQDHELPKKMGWRVYVYAPG